MKSENDKPALIISFTEYHIDQLIKFVIKIAPEKLQSAEKEGLHKVFKLETIIDTTSMVYF